MSVHKQIVRASLYRHVHGVASKPENEYTHIKAQATGDGTFITANEKLFAYAGALPGRVHVWPLDKPGRIGADAPYIHVHKAGVLDYEFNTLFHDTLTDDGASSLLATASDDCLVAVTAIPNTGLKSNVTEATVSLKGHERRVNVVHWHPTASHIVGTGSADQTIKVWDLNAGSEALSFDGFGDGVSAFDWHINGSQLISTCKDTKVRVYDPRASDAVTTFQGFNGAGISRMVWKGDSSQVFGVGNIKGGSRQMGIWDIKNTSKPIMVSDLDNAGGSLFPMYDPDNAILYISGKGDGNIRYWEVSDDEPYVHFINAYADTKSHAGVVFLPKRACDYAECEIAIALRMMGDKVTKVSFRVPRKQTGPTVFHKDLYPETASGLKPAALTGSEWLAGENRPIVKMPMNIAAGAREMSSTLTSSVRAASGSVSPRQPSGSVSPRDTSNSLTTPTSTTGRSIPELERMLAQAKLKIMDLQAEIFELEQKAAKKSVDKNTATKVVSPVASVTAVASSGTSPVASPRDSSESVSRSSAASVSASVSTDPLPGESEAQTAARVKKAKAKAAVDARDAAARERATTVDVDKAKREEKEAAEKAAKAEKEAAEKKIKDEKAAADKQAKEEAAAADKKAKEDKEDKKNKAEKEAAKEKEAAERKAKEDKEAAEKKARAAADAAAADAAKAKEAAAKEAAAKEAALRKASAASAESEGSTHHMRFHADSAASDDEDELAERARAEGVAKAEAIERAEALAKKQKEIEAKAKATMEEAKKKAKDDLDATKTEMKTSMTTVASAATSAQASPTNSAPSSEPTSPTGSKKGKKAKKDKKDKKKGDCIIC